MGINTVFQPPNNPDLSPCDFWLFPKLRGCRYKTIEERKEAVTKVIDMLTQEDFDGAFQTCWDVSTSTLQPEEITPKGTKFHVCSINKSAHTKKVWKLTVCTSYFRIRMDLLIGIFNLVDK